MTTTNQLRGNCQCCGRDQAVKNGKMAKHGYTVEHGWFAGVCSGEHNAPMQISRTVTDKIIADITAEIPELLAKADKVVMGKLLPQFVITGRYNNKVTIPYAEASEYDQRHARDQLVWELRGRAKAGESFIKTLGEIATEKHGKPLVEVAKKDAPAPIYVGDKKAHPILENSVYQCTRVDGARIYYKLDKNGKTFNGWIGSQSWRKMETV